MSEIAGAPLEHASISPPFYQERTFLAVVSLGLAGGDFAVYRLERARRRRRALPAGFASEAVFVVDLVESTRLATHYGDNLAMTARNTLKDRTLALSEKHGVDFTENTGDGCLMTFPTVAGAVETAIALLRDLRDRPADLSPGPPLAVRIGISYGEILLDARGGRHGAAMNKAFRLEGLSEASFVRLEGEGEAREIPGHDRIFLDEEAVRELAALEIPHRLVGVSSLKGFSGLHRVYEVVWQTPPL
jgi:class 3 adenylate cyclase